MVYTHGNVQARLRVLAAEAARAKAEGAAAAKQQEPGGKHESGKTGSVGGEGQEDEEVESTGHDPATRYVTNSRFVNIFVSIDRRAAFALTRPCSTKMYLEMAAQKREKAERQRQAGNGPVPERDAEEEQRRKLAKVTCVCMFCLVGGWDFGRRDVYVTSHMHTFLHV